jgi:hypothetical protein
MEVRFQKRQEHLASWATWTKPKLSSDKLFETRYGPKVFEEPKPYWRRVARKKTKKILDRFKESP